jgi:hypothetical protein
MLVRVFEQQCDVVDEKVVVKKHTGGDIVCNPSDPDATFDGHKGSGYQVQLSETCSPDNDMLCRSENISLVSPTSGKCPVDHVDPDAITVSDFRIEDGEAKDEYGRTIIVPTCVECPAGQKPHRSFYDDFLKQINILQHPHVCAACPLLQKCPFDLRRAGIR